MRTRVSCFVVLGIALAAAGCSSDSSAGRPPDLMQINRAFLSSDDGDLEPIEEEGFGEPVDPPPEAPIEPPAEEPASDSEPPADENGAPLPPDSQSRADDSQPMDATAEDAAAADNAVLADPRCPRRAPDYDSDGLCDELEATYGTDPQNPDTDGDSLGDGMEVLGYRFLGRTVYLPDANPRRKDIYLEIDYQPDYRPCQGAVDDVVAAFAAAPLANPDGSYGITLHAEVDDQQTNKTTDTNIGFPRRFRQLKRKYFRIERTPAYHWALFARQYAGSGSSGVSSNAPATDLMVTLGTFTPSKGTRLMQAGTLMHELGHNLGLEHGGPRLRGSAVDTTLYKPNYLSVMNYSYQFRGVPIGGVLELDYSSVPVPQLSERNLIEGFGLSDGRGSNATELASYGAPFICQLQAGNDRDGYYCDKYAPYALGESAAANVDWNLNDIIDQKPVTADLNGSNGAEDTFQAIEADWHNLEY
ncbi:MAG TPA: hypothetical protein VJR89_39430, partial [Polyangiales bacterium]|nr:hypothetical protein [Polyangiales bacterium]